MAINVLMREMRNDVMYIDFSEKLRTDITTDLSHFDQLVRVITRVTKSLQLRELEMSIQY